MVGSSPQVKTELDGSSIKIQYSKSANEHSLAVQSAFIVPEELARIYFAARTENGVRLKALVREALTGSEPNFLTKVRIEIEDLLLALDLRKPSTGDLYVSVFTGEKTVPTEKLEHAQDQWEAFATVAAAHELVGPRQR
jgi:hypothetical protein